MGEQRAAQARVKRKQPESRIAPLRQVLKYQNDDVIRRFLGHFRVSKKTAELLFQDVLRYLWITARGQDSKPARHVWVIAGMELMDEVWHEFVLFMPQYEEFCTRYFGRVMYHAPTTSQSPESQMSAAEYDAHIDAYIELVFDELGEDVATRWFSTYRRKFSAEFMDARRVSFVDARSARQARGRTPARKKKPVAGSSTKPARAKRVTAAA